MKKAFTLAEILITLSIIGVVAALTIPTLIQRTGDEEIVSKLSKAYSTLSQASEMIMTEQGSPKVWNTDVDSLYNAYKSHLRNAKECGSTSGCLSAGKYRFLKSSGYDDNWDNSNIMRKLILSDGTQIAFGRYLTPDCTGSNHGSKNICADILVDLNGSKAPNIIGRDLFAFVLKETGLYPAGCDVDECSTAQYGYGCACRVLQEGKIDY